jgi:fibronectin type 3 domain-containing protein
VTATVNDGRGGTDVETFSWPIAEAPDTTPPSVPGNLTVNGTTTTSISLNWDASSDTGGSGLVGYRIYRDESATPLATVTGRTYTNTGLVTGGTHAYRVTAYDNAGNESAAAGPVTGVARDIQAPSVPTSLAISGTTTTSIKLSWGASTDTGGSGRAGYRIYRDGSATPLATVTGKTYTNTGLVTGSTHTYRVTAYDNAGNESAAAGPVTGVVSDVQAPSVPTNLRITGTTTTSVSLSWGASTDTGGSGRAGYRIYRDGSATPLATVTGRTYTNTGLFSGTSYAYRVTAYDNAGNESAPAGPVTGATL